MCVLLRPKMTQPNPMLLMHKVATMVSQLGVPVEVITMEVPPTKCCCVRTELLRLDRLPFWDKNCSTKNANSTVLGWREVVSADATCLEAMKPWNAQVFLPKGTPTWGATPKLGQSRCFVVIFDP